MTHMTNERLFREEYKGMKLRSRIGQKRSPFGMYVQLSVYHSCDRNEVLDALNMKTAWDLRKVKGVLNLNSSWLTNFKLSEMLLKVIVINRPLRYRVLM